MSDVIEVSVRRAGVWFVYHSDGPTLLRDEPWFTWDGGRSYAHPCGGTGEGMDVLEPQEAAQIVVAREVNRGDAMRAILDRTAWRGDGRHYWTLVPSGRGALAYHAAYAVRTTAGAVFYASPVRLPGTGRDEVRPCD